MAPAAAETRRGLGLCCTACNQFPSVIGACGCDADLPLAAWGDSTAQTTPALAVQSQHSALAHVCCLVLDLHRRAVQAWGGGRRDAAATVTFYSWLPALCCAWDFYFFYFFILHRRLRRQPPSSSSQYIIAIASSPTGQLHRTNHPPHSLLHPPPKTRLFSLCIRKQAAASFCLFIPHTIILLCRLTHRQTCHYSIPVTAL